MYKEIYPKPCKVSCSEGQFNFGKELTLKISKNFSKRESLPVIADLWKNFTAGICKLNILQSDDQENFLFTIGNPANVEIEKGMTYVVYTDENGIAIKADSDLSLLHGFYTLLQIIRPIGMKCGEESFAVNCGRIDDAPSLGFRCMHFSISFDTNLHKLRKCFKMAAFLKFTHFAIEFFGSLRFDCLAELSWPGAFGKEDFKPIFDEARAMGVELIPLFNSLGHAGMGNLMNCKNVVLDQNPRLALLFEPDGWSFCISNPETIKLINNASDELIELMGPGEYFHMGLDESHDFATCDLCYKKDKGEFLAEYVNSVAERMRKKGRKTMIWADMLLNREQFDPELTYRTQPHFPVANASDKMPTHEALGKIDKDVIIVDWQYYTEDRKNPTARHISDSGYQVVTASYEDFKNMQLMALSAGENNYFGYMSTGWGVEKNNADLILYSADVAWNAKRADEIDSFRLEQRFYAVGNLQRKLLPTSASFELAGWF